MSSQKAPSIAVRGVGKSYSGVTVLHDIDLDVAPGEVHGLVGENGAGKSTLLKILGGAIKADAGTLSFDGEQVSLGSPRDSIGHGISLISQEGALVPALSVLDNVFLARWSHRGGLVNARSDRKRLAALLETTGFAVDPDERVDRLPIGVQQQVEILRSLARGARVIAMDEPTAVLAEHEKENLLALIRKLAAGGTTIILVSHFLEEVLSVADRITVLRDGALIRTVTASETSPRELVGHMVGREIDVLYPDPQPVPDGSPVVLAARGLRRGLVNGIDLEVRAGEILGIAGLVGSGRTETLRLLFGADRPVEGVVEVDGVTLAHYTPRAAMAAGIAMVPESRKEQGLVMQRSIAENVALSSLSGRRSGPFVKRPAEKTAVGEISKSVDIRAANPEAPIETLSGGNQQKALFAKWLLRNPKVLLIDEPTRGVDVAAKTQIHHLITGLAAEGMAVVCVSSEIEELLALSHRVLVLRHGEPVGEYPRGTTPEVVIAAAFGSHEGEPS